MIEEPNSTPHLTSPSVVRKLLSQYGIVLRPELGQHFLVDENIRGKIVDAVQATGEELVVEIGAGMGTLTVALAPKVRKLWAVEIDRRLSELLRDQVAPFPNVEVISADFLNVSLSKFGEGLIVVGNLPFGITSDVLLKLIREREVVDRAVLMTQWEVAEKIVAPSGPKSSRLGVYLRAYFDIEIMRRVRRTVFFPPPEVDAAVIHLEKLSQPRIAAPDAVFERVLEIIYGTRRKTLRRALFALLPKAEVDRLLVELSLDPNARGEALPLAEIDRLAQALADRIN